MIPLRAPPGVLLVALRELRWIRRDRIALFLIFGVPLIAFALLAGTFSSAVVRGVGVIVVDNDHSARSRQIVEAIAAAPGVSLAQRADDLGAATRAIRSGAAIAAAYIPRDFERDLAAGRRPQIEVFYNTQFMTPGNIAGRAIHDAIEAASRAMAPAAAGILPRPSGALVIEQYVLANPAFNYAQFLLRAVLPTVLHVVIAVAAGYSVGSEFSRRSLRAWLHCAGGSPLAALVGKIAPLFAVFLLMMVVLLFIIHGALAIPFRGDALMMAGAACLFILAYQALGTLLQLLVRNLPLGLSLTAIIVSPAFGYAGVGYPVLGMAGFPRVWGSLLPLRWYIQILFDQAARGAPVRASAVPYAILAAMAIVLWFLCWLRLRAVAQRPAPAHPEPPPVPFLPGLGGAFVGEWRRMLAETSVFGLFVIAPLLYGIYYPQPYLGQLLRGVPIAVVDQDRTALSRGLIEALDADEAVKVAVRADTLAEAQRAVFERRAFAILDIPPDTEREMLKGNDARLPAYVDSTYFLIFNRALEGIGDAVLATTADELSHGARTLGALYRTALAAVSSVEILMEPLFNPTGGYASYVVPAAFVLILQQTLLMGAAMLGGIAFETGGPAARGLRGSAAAVLGQAIAHLTIYAAPFALLMIVLPRVYGFSALGRPLDLALLGIPFILATSLNGPGRRRLAPPARDRRPALHRHQPAAVLPRRRLLAARGDPAGAPRLRALVSERGGDRRPRADRSDGGAARRAPRRLGHALAAGGDLFHRCRGGEPALCGKGCACVARSASPCCWPRSLSPSCSPSALPPSRRSRPSEWCGRPRSASRPKSAAVSPPSTSSPGRLFARARRCSRSRPPSSPPRSPAPSPMPMSGAPSGRVSMPARAKSRSPSWRRKWARRSPT
jgi:ABC-2 type transport system permease protein